MFGRNKINNIMFIFIMIALMVVLYVSGAANKLNQNQMSYEDIVSADLDNQYPSDPLMVLSYYLDSMNHIYSLKLNDEEIKNLLSVTRKLYSEELLNSDLAKTQTDFIIENVKSLRESNSPLIQIAGIFNLDEDSLNSESERVIRVLDTKTNDTLITFTCIFENNQWKILNWY